MIKHILIELKEHAPFTAFGAITGIVILLIIVLARLLNQVAEVSFVIFYVLHPTHIVLSAIVTTAMFKLHRPKHSFFWTILVGYVGSVGIATLSDSVIPHLGEMALNLPHRGTHIGFLEEPWPINCAAFLGIAIAFFRPATKFPHSGHVLISTWASLFHIIMALGETINLVTILSIFVFLFLAVWFPCCLSDIIFPLLFVPAPNKETPKKFQVEV